MNYGDIKSHFNELLNRSDITPTLTTQFVDQGISRIQRQLRTPLNENVSTYVITGQTPSLTLPTDFLEIISIYHESIELKRVPMETFRPLAQNPMAGRPEVFVRQQQDIQMHPQPTTGNVVLYYYGEFAPMVLNTDENTLAAVAPDLITYAALTYAADYYLDERGPLFEDKFRLFLSELQAQSDDQELNGGVQSIQPMSRYDDYQSTYIAY